MVRLRSNLADSNCYYFTGLSSANILRPDQFYLNLDYWLADVKLNDEIMKNQRCMQLLIEGMQKSPYLVSAAVAIAGNYKRVLC